MPQATGVGRKTPRASKSGLEGKPFPQPKGGHPSLDLQARHTSSDGGSTSPWVNGDNSAEVGWGGNKEIRSRTIAGRGEKKQAFLALPHGEPLVLAHVWEVS